MFVCNKVTGFHTGWILFVCIQPPLINHKRVKEIPITTVQEHSIEVHTHTY